LLRRKYKVRRRSSQGERVLIFRDALGIFVTADAAPGLMWLNPDPTAIAKRHTVFVESLKQYGGIGRYFHVE
jgi:hypothetical protein